MKKIIAGLLALFCGFAVAQQVYVGPNTAGKSFFSMAITKVDPLGNQYGGSPTYSATISAFTPVSTATDFFCLSGSATRNVIVLRVKVQADSSAIGVNDFYAIKRTTANTGGTKATVSATPFVTIDPAATASAYSYSVNPTSLGTGMVIASNHFTLAHTATTGYPSTDWIVEARPEYQGLLLAGVNESLCFNLNGASLTSGLQVWASIVWIEE